jgi:hypothetical protein
MNLTDAASARLLRLDQPDAAGNLENGGLHAYWRKPDGDIVISGMGPHEVQAALESDFTLLKNYGKFPIVPSRKGAWEPNFDPYYLILSLGGIKEFSLDQVYQHRWHLRPHPVLAAQIKELTDKGLDDRDALETVIPQLKGQDWKAVYCPHCPSRIFNNEHQLGKHEIIHKAEKTQRQMGETIAEALAAAQTGNMATLGPILETMAKSQEALSILVQQLMAGRQDNPEAAPEKPSARKGS